ncbi:Cytochrome c oxidase subunit 6C-2 [Orchesella cincta]|uniref:Cytochrome c oxidase subunit 6C-2 n=1 Tax=Orchesella cincta TaxID=48709 RepID=A0A1D2NJ42_ORCCI|nr:Cytochrome c oxidase subunit 6C-2 [Orchesella cincta]
MGAAAPQMRGFLVSRFKRDMVISLVASICTVTAWRLFYVNPRKQRYADFYKTYDINADYERMKAAGVFQSVSPDE